jgi:diguanylate cyclase (GGDEF)-like protein
MVLFATAIGPTLIARAWTRGREGSLLFLIGLVVLSAAAIHDVAVSNLRSLPILKVFGGGPYYLQSLGFLVFALCQSAVLALRSSRTMAALERTGAELRATRDELEQRVAARTAELKTANRELQRLAGDDGLTALANRRRFDERLAEAWRDHARRRAPLALVLADIDRFKDFNDRYGHPAGDSALRRVAQASAASARSPLDLVARYGGEELVTLLPDTSLEGAVRVAERQRAAVLSLEIPHGDNDHGHLSLSLGVASCIPGEHETPESLIERADAALYEAKRLGRNQVVGDPSTEEPDPT